jgi:hypothetical protein
MGDFMGAAFHGDVDEVKRLVGLDPGLLRAGTVIQGFTPLQWAAKWGHVRLVGWMSDNGAAMEEQCAGHTALWLACYCDRFPVVRLLVERGADPTTACHLESCPTTTLDGMTTLMAATCCGSLEMVRFLLRHVNVKAVINHRNREGQTALWKACYWGKESEARALLESGADPTAADNRGITPMAIAMQKPADGRVSSLNRQKCVAVLEVSFRFRLSLSHLLCTCSSKSADWDVGSPIGCEMQEAERAYLIWKARQVADAAASFAAEPVVEARTRGEVERRRVEAVPEELRGRVAARGGGGLPGVSVVAASEGEEGRTRAALLNHAVHSLKPGVFEELMELMG